MRGNVLSTFSVALVFFLIEGNSAIPQQGSTKQYGITNYEINEGIKRLEKNVKDLENKLSRHEFREAQVADFSTKTLNALNSDHALNQKNMKTVARQLANLEEKLLAMDALLKTTDERQRDMMRGISDGLNRLLMMRPDFPSGPPLPPLLPPPEGVEVEKEVKKVLRRVNVIEESMKRSLNGVNNEVKIVGESLRQHMEQLTTRQDRIWNDWTTCNNDQIRAMTEAASSLSQTEAVFLEQIAGIRMNQANGEESAQCGKLSEDLGEKMDALDSAYRDQEKELAALKLETHQIMQEQNDDIEMLVKETKIEKELLENSFGNVIGNLQELQNHSDRQLGQLENSLKNVAEESAKQVSVSVDRVAEILKEKSLTILNALDDSASMSDNLQHSMSENFEDLTNDIRSLKKVEQVMLNTADAVLDTKRSIEFGIQQVILELSDTVRNSGETINSTLADQINSISFHILRNQSTALTNMTKRLEEEISQVWRQIGIMYQQVSQSVDILDELQTTTAQQMNASLDKVGTMDGTVGAINNKVADVEDNLNYLLGRLSLVTSEFSQMKVGVGAELEKLRKLAQEYPTKDTVEYTVNKKRSVDDTSYVPQHDSQ